MAIRIIKLPDVGEGVAEAEVVEWHVKVGDAVLEDQVLAAVMTDKATVEVPSPVAGTVIALGAEVGATLAVGAELVRLEVAGAADEPAAAEVAATPRQAAASPPAAAPAPAADNVVAMRTAAAAPAADSSAPTRPALPRAVPGISLGPPRAAGEKPLASPAVRKRARDAGIDLRQVRGSGPAGRISHDDLDIFMRGGPAAAGPAARTANTAVETIKVVGLRRRIAQRMAEAKRRAAHFAYVEEVDATALEDLRAALNAEAQPDRPRLTLLPFLMQAVVKAVVEFPQMNALYDDEADVVERFGGVHIGIATQTPNGLMVPVARHCEARGLFDGAAEAQRLAQAAREGRATREELTGSTITITSLGALGGIVSTPVLNRPEVAIIGINKLAVRPMWQGGQFVPRKMMNLSSSFDHRIVDGYDAARFIQRIKALLEAPATIFIDG
ncbi:dihydrolipoamide acetyltransferase family protein [Reyranella sp. CPCC 100927]|uniref:dihydrolipoamide acetyltransferase family protein n=1 Tax=Reyranella sp. CPCC 100927 TaxID=2599616 RepID=UPI0011B4CB86|nr:dihydrolipoamide acetyltransferase family protein [Reyranella sp. CPCC 100927]TWT09955.1 2-oxo acid dehydrogenase subunit E2 [Reyranella sp. CPCC 100927]